MANITDYTMKGRTYRYYEEDPLYPFGYGLSYTQFKYSSLNVSPMKVAEGQDVSVNLVVTNTGSHDADEVSLGLESSLSFSLLVRIYF